MDAAQNCKRRVEHLKLGAVGILPVTESSISYSLWKKTRVERFLVDHLLRSGHYSTGISTTSSAVTISDSCVSFEVAMKYDNSLLQLRRWWNRIQSLLS